MPYVRRDAAGLIVSLHRSPEASAEFLADEHPEVQAFVGRSAPGPSGASGSAESSGFGRLDAEFVRVLEDLIDTLIVKNLLNITDLPEQAQAKLLARKSFRERASKSSLQLFDRPTGYGDVI